MSLLYVVSESENDGRFYAQCTKKLTGDAPDLVVLRGRKAEGVESVKRGIKNAIAKARAAARGTERMFFIAAIDNDRAPHEENRELDRSRLSREEYDRPSRMEWMKTTVESVLGPNRQTWPMSVALAVPVEMIESWIVRGRRNAELQPARYFSWADSQSAREYYAPAEPPPQWKDLAREEQAASGFANKQDFYVDVILNLDADALAARSPSFRMFKEWLDGWPLAESTVGA